MLFVIVRGHVLYVTGKEQADMTAQRLKALDLPIDRIVISTMTRAQESGEIISKYFPDVKPEHCNLIREGAPIPPEPPSSVWRPEAAVITFVSFIRSFSFLVTEI